MPKKKRDPLELELGELGMDADDVELGDLSAGDDDLGDVDEDLEEDEGDLIEDTKAELEDLRSEFQKRAKRETERFYDTVDSEFWVAFCFQTRAQKEEFLKKLKLISLGDKYINGLHAAKRLGVEIKSPSPVWRASRGSKRLKELT